MRTNALTVVLLTLLTIVPVSRAHPGGFDLGDRTVPTVDDLIAQAGSEAHAQTLVDAAVRAHFGFTSGSRTIRLVAAQVRPDWLPKIEDVTFILLNDEDARIAHASCDGCWFLGPIRDVDGLVSVEINQGNVCVTRTSSYQYRLERGTWYQDVRSASGSILGMDHCRCTP